MAKPMTGRTQWTRRGALPRLRNVRPDAWNNLIRDTVRSTNSAERTNSCRLFIWPFIAAERAIATGGSRRARLPEFWTGLKTMPKARAPTPRRRTILKLLAGSIAGARLSGLGSRFAAAAVPPLAGGDSVMSLEFDDDLRSRVLARGAHASQPLTDFEASETLRLADGSRIDRFAFFGQQRESVNNAHGSGTRHVLRGLAAAGIEK